MGCDIHAMIEAKRKNRFSWVNRGDPDISRNYLLFSILGNMRNYNEIPSIAEHRGIPDNCCNEYEAWSKDWEGDAHSHSWVKLKELKEYDLAKTFIKSDFTFIDLKELITKMEQFGTEENVRLVFFFDN